MPNKFEVDVAVRSLHHTRDGNELHCLHTGEDELGPCLVATTFGYMAVSTYYLCST